MSRGFFDAPLLGEAMGRGQDNFGILRLVLAIAVVVSHAFSVITGQVDDEPLTRLTGFTLGEHAVNGFFAVSGFLVAMSYDRRGWKAYAVARATRILPGLVMAILMVALVAGPMLTTLPTMAYFRDASLWKFLGQAFSSLKSTGELPGVFQQNPFRFPIGTIWTLKYEILCYIGLCLMGIAGLFRFRLAGLLLVIALFTAVIGLDFARPEAGKGLQTSLRLPLIFAVGSCLYLYRDRVRLSLIGLLIMGGASAIASGGFSFKALMFVSEAYGVIFLALWPGLTGWVKEPPLDLSYGTYLYGWPVQQGLHALFPQLSAPSLLVPSLIVTLLVAALSWQLIEKPAMRFKSTMLRRLQK